MSSIRVFNAAESLAAITADASKVLTAEKKKDDKAYRGTRYLNLYFNIGTAVKADGWFNMTNVTLSDGIADPNDKTDVRNEFEGTRLQLQTSVSRAGDFGKFLQLANGTWIELVNRLVAEGVIVAGSRKIHELLQTTLSANNKTNPGGLIDDPIIRFKIDFGVHPEKYKHKFLAGKPKSQILDYTKTYKDEEGKTQYQVATVKDPLTGQEVPVNAQNIHLFVKSGAILRFARVMIPSIAISQAWVSAPMTISRAVIEPGTGGGFSDDAEVAVETANSAIMTAVATPVVNAPANVPQVTLPVGNNPTVDEIDDVLANI